MRCRTKKLSNSYDFFLRGEEILSGGQRVHIAPLLEERMKEVGVEPDTMKEYVEGFKWGCPPVSRFHTVAVPFSSLTSLNSSTVEAALAWSESSCYS